MISVTLLSSYLYCPRKLFLERVLKLAEPPKESLVLGSISHKFYEETNNMEEGIVTGIKEGFDYSRILDLYKQNYENILNMVLDKNKKNLDSVSISIENAKKSILPKIICEANSRAFNILTFIKKNNVFGEELWQKLTPKIESEIKIISENLRLVGVIDQLHKYKEGIVPFELKTGKAPRDGVWPSHRIQVAAYAMLLEDKFGSPVKEAYIRYLDYEEERHVAINPMMKEEVIELTNKIINLLQSKNLPDFCDNKNKCVSCGLRNMCYDSEEMNNIMKKNFPSANFF